MSLSGKVQTVLGVINPEQLGVTLTHEHLCIDYETAFFKPWAGDENKIDLDFQLKNLGWIRQFPYSSKQNLSILDQQTLDSVTEEIKKFKALGGNSIVEVTNHGLARNMEHVLRLAKETGVNVIAGTGYYFDKFQPDSVRKLSVEAMVDQCRKDILTGWGETGAKCGVIGEVGCSWPLTSWEKSSLKASAIAHSELGAPIIIHPGRNSKAPEEIMRILQEAGAQASMVVMSHIDRTISVDDTATLLEFAAIGAYIEFDLFGIEVSLYQANEEVDMPSDAQRIQMIKCLLDNGYEDQIVIAHDVHTKHRLEIYGGHGYTHIQRLIVPMMKKRGITQQQIDKILIHNPKRWLAFK